MRIFALGLLLFSVGAGAQTIVLVRHAEKADAPKDDPALSEAGQRRAQALAVALKRSNVTAVYTTQLRRTQETAAPLATAAGVTPRVLTVARGGVAEHVAEAVKLAREKPDGVVVIVGHSNTVPAIARALGADAADMPECEYSRLITLLPGLPARTIVARYGEPDGACP
ncbi:MAG: histidine phosphatase family protein [Burkholderiales bacterium]|nr:histidine phosphatase family protein [Burkholderiales bacterium]